MSFHILIHHDLEFLGDTVILRQYYIGGVEEVYESNFSESLPKSNHNGERTQCSGLAVVKLFCYRDIAAPEKRPL